MLTIPKTQRLTAERIVAMPPEQMRAIATALAAAPPAESFSALLAQLDSKIKAIPDLIDILQVLSDLGSIAPEEGLSVEKVASELVAAAQADGGMNPSDGNWDRLKTDLAVLFKSSESVVLTGKARELISEHEHSYCPDETRVISDVRAIFSLGEIKKPAAAVIIHVLKLAYHEGDDQGAFFVGLDQDDIRQLRDLVDRAIAKETALKEMISASGTPFVASQTE